MVKNPFTSLDGAENWVNNWADSVSEQAARAQALADRVSAMTSSASGAQGAVGVTVDGSGALADLRPIACWDGRPAISQRRSSPSCMRRRADWPSW